MKNIVNALIAFANTFAARRMHKRMLKYCRCSHAYTMIHMLPLQFGHSIQRKSCWNAENFSVKLVRTTHAHGIFYRLSFAVYLCSDSFRRRLNRRYFKLVGQLCVGELLYALHLPGKGAEEILGW